MSSGTITHTNSAYSGLDKALLASLAGLVSFVIVEILLSPVWALAVLAVITIAVCSWYRPLWVVWAIAAVLPFEPFVLKWVGDELYIAARYASEALIYIVAGVTVIQKCVQGKRLSLGPLALPLATFAGIAVASAVANHNTLFDSAMGLRQIFRYMLLYVAVVLLAPHEKWTQGSMIGIAGIALFESVLGSVQALTGGSLDGFLMPTGQKFIESITLTMGTSGFWQEGQRVFATMGRYDQLGIFLSFVLLLVVGFLFENTNRKPSRFWWWVLGAGCVALVLTYSRAAWFGFAIGFAVCGIGIKRNWRIAAGYMAVLLLAVAMYASLGIAQHYRIDLPNQTLTERLFESVSIQRILGEYYALGRTYFLLHVPVNVLEHAPLLGVGPGMFGGGAAAALHNTEKYAELNLPYGINGTEGYIDNNWLSLLGETGYLGVAAYALILIVLARTALRVHRSSQSPLMRGLALGYCGALAAFAFQGFFATYFEVRTLAPYIWIFGGILAAEDMKILV
ncbi:MAG: O-antigen ligase family protein [Patescibacteria group bacterium]